VAVRPPKIRSNPHHPLYPRSHPPTRGVAEQIQSATIHINLSRRADGFRQHDKASENNTSRRRLTKKPTSPYHPIHHSSFIVHHSLFNFFHKKPAPAAHFGFLGVDMHSHILPGIDDGAPDMETSMQLIRGLQDMGFRKLIATPHIYKELYPNTVQTIRNALALVHTSVKEAGIDVEIDAAAEYFLDEHFEELLARDELLTLPDRHILIEMSFMAPYPKLNEIVFQLCTKGYKPILAHPERYLYYADHPEQFERIRDFGCKLQVNTLSLSGYYGKPSQKLAQRLIEAGLISFLGTDLHHHRHHENLKAALRDARLVRMMEQIPTQNNNWL